MLHIFRKLNFSRDTDDTDILDISEYPPFAIEKLSDKLNRVKLNFSQWKFWQEWI